MKNYNVIINENNFCDEPIDSVKKNERNLPTGQDEDQTTG